MTRQRRSVAATMENVRMRSRRAWTSHHTTAELSGVASAGEIPADARVIVNPVSGERVVIRVSGAETDGELLVFDLYLPHGAHVPARHVHPVQEERFTVLAGQMRFRVGRLGQRSILAKPGDTIRVPSGTAHWFGNASAEMAHARVEVRPALRMEELFETTEAMGLERPGRTSRRPRLTGLAYVVLEFQREVAVPTVPPFLVKILLAPLAWLGRRHVRDATSRLTG
jgi:quercetin dioxygenase-like cupin family protein